MNITEIIKTSLKYPKNNFENTVFFTVFLTLFSFLTALGYSRVISVEALQAIGNAETFSIGLNQFINTIPQFNWIIFVISIICAIILFIVLNGYAYRIYGENDNLANFDNIKLLLIQGIKVIVVSIVYYFIPFVFLTLGIFFNSILTLIGAILLIIVHIFLQPMAVAHMVNEDNFKSAFELSEIIEIIKEITLKKYIGSIIFSFIVQLIILIAFWVVGLILIFLSVFAGIIFTVIFLVLIFFLYAYLELFSIKIYQLLYNQKKVI